MTTITTSVGAIVVGSTDDPSPLLITETGTVAGSNKAFYSLTSDVAGNVVQNDGVIQGFTGTQSTGAGSSSGDALELELGTIKNNGVIEGLLAVVQSGGTLTNTSIVSGVATDAVDLSGGLLTNSGDITGLLNGVSQTDGTLVNDADGVISGYQTLTGVGVDLSGGTLANAGTVMGYADGLDVSGGAATNEASGRITGTLQGVYQTGGTFTNAGSVTGGNVGEQLEAGTLINETGATIGDPTGGGVDQYGGTISNSGTISGRGSGLFQVGGGSATNNAGGAISSVNTAVFASGATLDNFGTITGAEGVDQQSGEVLTNHAGGVISGDLFGVGAAASTIINAGTITATDYGVKLTDDATLRNSGTLSGGEAAVQFNGNSTLEVASGAVFDGAISGFDASDLIDITNLTPTQVAADFGETATAYPGGILAFAGGATGDTLVTPADGTLNLTGDFSDEYFILKSDGSGGTDITLSQTACYCRGTRIGTECGDVPIQGLVIGQMVRTAAGELRPVKWLGHRRLDCSRYREPAQVWPVRIQAGAFGEALPRHDLWVSPGHSLAVDGGLIQAQRLINGTSIVQVPVGEVEYWHVELDSHDIVFAEGLAAESYLDTGNRTAFVNGGAYLEAYPDFKPRHWTQTCVPFATDAAVAEAKAMLIARAQALGYALTGQSDVHVVADGRRIEPEHCDTTRVEFRIPAGCRVIELRCRTYVPAHTVPSSGDTRPLGLCVAAVEIDGSPWPLADEARFAQGWHGLELHAQQPQRWSRSRVPLPEGTEHLLLRLAGDGRYWLESRDAVESSRYG